MNKFYTGVGTRNIKSGTHVYSLLVALGTKLATQGYILRSGAADGADTAFERGCDAVSGDKEIYIPWYGFNGKQVQLGDPYYVGISPEAEDIANSIHPAWQVCLQGAKKLHTRNIFQVLGLSLSEPSKFLVCYADVDKQGVPVGGTRTAWICAQNNKIPCYNLFFKEHLTRIEEFVKV